MSNKEYYPSNNPTKAEPPIDIDVPDPGTLSIKVFSPPDGLGQSWSLPPGHYVIRLVSSEEE